MSAFLDSWVSTQNLVAKPFLVGHQGSLNIHIVSCMPVPDACEVNNLCQMSHEFGMPFDVIYIAPSYGF